MWYNDDLQPFPYSLPRGTGSLAGARENVPSPTRPAFFLRLRSLCNRVNAAFLFRGCDQVEEFFPASPSPLSQDVVKPVTSSSPCREFSAGMTRACGKSKGRKLDAIEARSKLPAYAFRISEVRQPVTPDRSPGLPQPLRSA